MEHVDKFRPNVLKASHRFMTSRNIGAVVPNLFLRSLDFKPFIFNEVSNHADNFNIVGCIEADAFRIASGFDDCELRFPET